MALAMPSKDSSDAELFDMPSARVTSRSSLDSSNDDRRSLRLNESDARRDCRTSVVSDEDIVDRSLRRRLSDLRQTSPLIRADL